ncbi:hypothetical protein F511_10084 [Dorcoceras hygrometricum]|uniref:Coenzyme Q-binding protein COQ10 START domain-containing protein n=1 Tax=Dorcoceras hygrometricum TaxID=472368 RepID=A0A2Z7AC33_9LAMI|nr:hypothetical protein F511_10084 [Dorcoceras hygrometricum]
MASLLFTAATLSYAATSTIPRLSIAKSTFLVTTLRKLQPYDVYYLPSVVSWNQFFKSSRFCIRKLRTYSGGNPKNNPVAENDGDDGGEDGERDTNDTLLISEIQEDNIEIEIENTGKNSRRIRSKVVVQANLQTLWEVLTDYERLADFIPGLAVSQLLEKGDNFARLFQIGEQDLAFGLKFNAKGTIDCFEKDLQTIPFGQKRDIEFKMVEGDFQLFEGKWSVEQVVNCNPEDLKTDSVVREFQTTLVYVVDVKPKLWLPVRLVEGRLCTEIRTNLSCIRQEAERVFQSANSAL